jgi:tRNA threonylcarbamoyladenosine biosynthesis protein TsaB
MILAIDTSDNLAKVLLFQSLANGREKTIEKKFPAKPISQTLLLAIDKLLKSPAFAKASVGKQKTTIKDLKAIVVFQGPGSYTGLRVGISVANALGFVLKIPVIPTKEKDLKKAVSKIASQNLFQKFTPIFPIYGRH